MVAIVDYGVGNLFSLKCSLDAIGIDSEITGDAETIRAADRVILPGVGAFADAAKKLKSTGLAGVLKDEAKKGKPILGICLGMQLLFEKSCEYGDSEGLGLIPGEIVPIEAENDLKVPHMGWNALELGGEKSKLFKYIKDGDFVYFVHSYYAKTDSENVIAYTDYGNKITAAVSRGSVYGCQFHPEKSGSVGLSILKAFCEV